MHLPQPNFTNYVLASHYYGQTRKYGIVTPFAEARLDHTAQRQCSMNISEQSNLLDDRIVLATGARKVAGHDQELGCPALLWGVWSQQ